MEENKILEEIGKLRKEVKNVHDVMFTILENIKKIFEEDQHVFESLKDHFEQEKKEGCKFFMDKKIFFKYNKTPEERQYIIDKLDLLDSALEEQLNKQPVRGEWVLMINDEIVERSTNLRFILEHAKKYDDPSLTISYNSFSDRGFY